MIGQTIAHYEIEDQLGEGGMGIVYRALDTKLKRRVALKFLPPQLSEDDDSKERFIQEAQAASGLDHPNICTIYEIGETDDGRLFIAMSYYDGQTLKYLLEEGAMPPKRAGSIAAQIAEGLQKAHEAGIVHRDIKPANIMVTNDGRVKILDFGVAKLGEGADLTKAGSTVGTTSYMSPEQSRGDKVDARTDLWSLGVILYELLSGARAFGGGYDQAVLYSVLNEDPEPLGDDVPEDLQRIVGRLLRKDPGDRYESAAAVSNALEPWSGTRTVTAASSVSKADGSTSARGVVDLKWAVPVAVALIAVIVWIFFGGDTAHPDAEEPAVATNIVAILPFSVQAGPELQYLGEGMVSLLSTMLDGAGSITVADHKAVIGNVQRRDDPVIDPATGQAIAAEFGASRFVLGSVIRAGIDTKLEARLYRADGALEAESESSFTGDEDFMAGVDLLASGLVSGLITDVSEQLGSLAAGTTNSFDALKHYLEAESLLRQADYGPAFSEVEQALNIDSTFALAWYLKSVIMGWTDQQNSEVPLLMAAKYQDNLPQRARNLVEGSMALHEGRREDGIRLYRSLLKENPKDLDVIGGLAEMLNHYGFRESEQREALTLFKKISEMGSDNSQYVMHVIDGAAYNALRDNNPYAVDSVAAVLAGMPVPEPGDSLDWGEALTKMTDDERRYVEPYALVRGSSEDSLEVIKGMMDVAPGFDAYRLVYYSDLSSSEAIIESNATRDERTETQFFRYVYDVARGQREKERELVSALPDSGAAVGILMLRILNSILPHYEAKQTELDDLSRRLAKTDAVWLTSPDYDGPGDLVRAYLNAQLAWRSGDREAFDAAKGLVIAGHNEYPKAELLRSFSEELEGLERWMDGDLDGAIDAMRRARPDGVYFFAYGAALFGRNQPTWFLAELLEERSSDDDLEEAIEWFSYATPTVGITAMAPGWERMAELHDRLGETDEAIRYYGLFIDRWKNADPVLQPRVEAARARMNALLDKKAQESR